ncbi:hypothetical protein CYMTET_36030 [Cymbomonas tetramitiformis]|uniref:Uncharacterized protein n=1 Tax=Cymbomonas tetramitiformis TaxID=36881 RepID=A0AAE0F821_9CHLO|nr:hypothetical protein CYMTET_36030 [Cymbomonas tetramitiformis]
MAADDWVTQKVVLDKEIGSIKYLQCSRPYPSFLPLIDYPWFSTAFVPCLFQICCFTFDLLLISVTTLDRIVDIIPCSCQFPEFGVPARHHHKCPGGLAPAGDRDSHIQRSLTWRSWQWKTSNLRPRALKDEV